MKVAREITIIDKREEREREVVWESKAKERRREGGDEGDDKVGRPK